MDRRNHHTAMKKKLIFTGYILLVLLSIEFAFRLLGNKPGDISPDWSNFKKVDTLISTPDFYFKNGIIICSQKVAAKYDTYINKDGFRNKEFDSIDSSKPICLLIGDSYTFGFSADPVSASFANILLADTSREYINLGVPVADPVQYEYLASKYATRFHPSEIIIPFFLGNDIMIHDRKIDTINPFWINTNAGGIFLDIDGKHFPTVQQAYNYILSGKYDISQSHNPLEKIIAQSAILSKIYSVKSRIAERQKFENAMQDMSITKSHLYPIAALCRQQDIKLRIVVIPELREAHLTATELRQKYKSLFSDTVLQQYISIPQVMESWYVPYPDAHLNNIGHSNYAKHILSTFIQ
jgi:hypothetical protein